MAILKVANRLFEFDEVNAFVEGTTADTFDSAFVSNSVAQMFITSDAYVSLLTPGTDGTQWFHFRLYPTSSGSNDTSSNTPWFAVFNSSGTIVADIIKTNNVSNSSHIRVYGTSTITSGGSATFVANTAYQIDIRVFVSGLTTTVDLYVDGTLVTSATNTNNGSRGIPNKAVYRSQNIGYQTMNRAHFSEFIIANTSTIGMRLDELPPTTAGSLTDMTGNVADLLTIDASTGLLTDVVGERHTWNPATYGGTGSIVALVLTTRAHRQSGVPSNLRQSLRIGGTNYDGADISVSEFTRAQTVWETNPATSVAWVAADFTGLEAGLLSVT